MNDPARRLDNRRHKAELRERLMSALASNRSGLSPNGRCALQAIGDLPGDALETFDPALAHGITHTAAAQVLNASGFAAKRRLNRSPRLLAERLTDVRHGEKLTDSM